LWSTSYFGHSSLGIPYLASTASLTFRHAAPYPRLALERRRSFLGQSGQGSVVKEHARRFASHQKFSFLFIVGFIST
jgi:hypothetical protein